MSDKLQAFLEEAEARAKHGTCLHSHDVEALVPIVKAFAAVFEEARAYMESVRVSNGLSKDAMLGWKLQREVQAADAAVAAHLKEVGE